MRVRNFVWTVMMLSCLFGMAQERYALLIGIGQYPEESGWNAIHGDNDVVIIKDYLLKQGFESANVSILTNSSATKSAIMSACDTMRMNVRQGDAVYIHFSGHGQQVTDLDGDEVDHYDEAWVPYDARKKYVEGQYEGENHILDDELNNYLNGLRAKLGARGKIVVVSDACHSGSGTRGLAAIDEDECTRGTNEPFEIPKQTANVIKKGAPVRWLHVAACKPFQTNYEYKTADGVFYGSLSFVITMGKSNLTTSHYRDVIQDWKTSLSSIVRYPQDLDDEGRPSRKSNKLF